VDTKRLSFLISSYNLTLGGFRRLFDIDERRARRMLKGDVPIPNSIAIAFELMHRHGYTPAQAYFMATGSNDFEG